MPLVSVILATYNRKRFLPKSIESVLGQTFTDFEFIIVDDGSTDGSAELISSYKDKRIVLIQQTNSGRSHARNRAIEVAKGQYIAFIDSDDSFVPTKLEQQVKILNNQPDIGMVYGAAEVVNEDDVPCNVIYKADARGDAYYKVAFYLPSTICLPTVMVRRSVLSEAGYFDIKMVRFEDMDLWRRISKITKIEAISDVICIIRNHGDNQMEDPKILLSRMDYWIKKIFRSDRDKSLFKQIKLASDIYFYYAAGVWHHEHFRRKASPFYLRATILSPLAGYRWKWWIKSLIYRLHLESVFKK